ncbi:MAG: hypothetical protein JWL69_3532 [Phycisphaerales bacterium]|nr:hypothetical protein [Phycisphaerales bacterium]MDB5356646.1 hypothetical protein [Phycisphaerales bacterium]
MARNLQKRGGRNLFYYVFYYFGNHDVVMASTCASRVPATISEVGIRFGGITGMWHSRPRL